VDNTLNWIADFFPLLQTNLIIIIIITF